MNFEVNRQNFRETRVTNDEPADLADGQVRLTIERFAITTNNITYAVAGDMLDYWGFFPVDQQWGRLPVMGLGTVAESANPDIAIGGRYFGFYPMADQVVITARATRDGFSDAGPNRSDHAVVYTGFRDVSTDPTFRADQPDEYLLLWGMFMTSFLADDYLADSNFHGASQTLVTSASSKTSISLASCLARREGHAAIGLTSERNRAFVESLRAGDDSLYDQVITYDEIDQLDANVPTGMVDMAGNGSVRTNVHNHFAENLKYSLSVGITHWEAGAGSADLPGPQPEMFFAPRQSAKRAKDWGPDELAKRIAEAFLSLLDGTSEWLTVDHRTGPSGMQQVYDLLVEGQADPAIGFIVSMTETSAS